LLLGWTPSPSGFYGNARRGGGCPDPPFKPRGRGGRGYPPPSWSFCGRKIKIFLRRPENPPFWGRGSRHQRGALRMTLLDPFPPPGDQRSGQEPHRPRIGSPRRPSGPSRGVGLPGGPGGPQVPHAHESRARRPVNKNGTDLLNFLMCNSTETFLRKKN